MTADSRPGSTTEQLRDDIDSGRTGDKVAVTDPAAAPLGTDDEAAGAAPASGVVEQARMQERAQGAVASEKTKRDKGERSIVMPAIIFVLCAAFAAILASLVLTPG
jgi:hypothetical protein